MAAELLADFEPEIETLALIPADGGRFEVSVFDRLIYSKLQTHRHAEPGEITALIRNYLEENL